jgi:intraflagellar transport protein 88
MTIEQDNAEGAMALYRRAIEIDGNFVEALYNLGLVQKKLGLLPDALGTFKSLANKLPNNVEILYQVHSLKFRNTISTIHFVIS